MSGMGYDVVLPRNWIGKGRSKRMARPVNLDPIDIYAYGDPREREDRKWVGRVKLLVTAILCGAGGYFWAFFQIARINN